MDPLEKSDQRSLSFFIDHNHGPIIERWEEFAKSISAARQLHVVVLRDHAQGMLRELALNLSDPQTPFEQAEKSKGRTPLAGRNTQAQLHGVERLAAGFSVDDTIAEFRALRASILQLWSESNHDLTAITSHELVRFNEAIDQALGESVTHFGLQKDEYTRRFDMLLSSSPDLKCIIGIDNRLMYVNQALRTQLAFFQEQIVGRRLDDLCPSLAPRIAATLRKVIETREPLSEEACLAGPDGSDVIYRYVLLPVMNENGEVESIAGTARNISELRAAEEQTYKNAYYDSLTLLPNRALFLDRLEQHVKNVERSGNLLALLFIDLDGFKAVNDRSGHAIGDQLLREAGHRIQGCVRGSDTVARIGGDEFTVIISDVADLFHIEILAQVILDELAKPFTLNASNYFISGSMGITLCPHDGHTPVELLRNSDQAMYIAKGAGGNRFCFFTAAMRESAWARLKLIDELREALALQQLEVYFQPIIDLQSGQIVKAEALVRWRHPRKGLVFPDAFIGLAEQCGLIGEIDTWVLREAVEHARQWSALLGRPFQISVNLSPVEFMSMAMLKSWDSDFEILKLARDEIAIEITEGVLLNDSSAVIERLATLKQAGVQLTIDDFGTGYSSMSYLKKFKVDFLKIDQSFVKDLMQNTENGIFAETIIVMAHRLGLKVIAEGVETCEQRDRLKAMECDYAQGYLYSEASPHHRMTEMLSVGRM